MGEEKRTDTLCYAFAECGGLGWIGWVARPFGSRQCNHTSRINRVACAWTSYRWLEEEERLKNVMKGNLALRPSFAASAKIRKS